MRPTSPRKPQLGRSSPPENGPTMPKPSVALCSPKPITSTSARLISPLAADWPIARPSEKLCSPMPVAIISDSDCAGDSAPGLHVVSATAAAPRLRNPPRRRRLATMLVEVDEAHEADREARRRRSPRGQAKRPHVPSWSSAAALQRRLDRLDPGREHVPEQEEQDAGRGRAEQRARPGSAERRRRPAGSPRKIVRPAIAPSTRICPCDTLLPFCRSM